VKAFIDQLLRPGQSRPGDVCTDLFWLIGLTLLLVATGIGLRDPWPADEPRFALIARDMVASGQWLIPNVGGDVYADKPPLFFWMIAAGIVMTGSVRWAFLLPSLLAAIGCVVLIYDLGRRLWNREVGLAAALALLVSLQFLLQARQAQIDATLCFFTTLSLYGLLRHCLLGPQWTWYAIGWAAAGLGIITKGVGFLPLLVLLPYVLSGKGGWQPRPVIGAGWRWLLGPLALVAAVSLWLVPVLIAAEGSQELRAYRDEILFGQTVTRYVSAWHHREPFWYFILEVIPGLWLPLTALLPWLLPRWRSNLAQRDLRVLLPLAWVGLVVVFFSLSTGKRGVYVLPALPALALASGSLLGQIAQRRGAQRLMFVLACSIATIGIAGGAWLLLEPAQRYKLIDLYDIDGVAPLLMMGVVSALTCWICRPSRGFLAWGLVMCEALLLTGLVINPTINESRSGAAFMRKVEKMAPREKELGLVGYKEQYLLELRRPVTTFGHARWRDRDQEAADASLWLSRDRDRVLLVNQYVLQRCFPDVSAREVGHASRDHWFLIEGPASAECVSPGRESKAIPYDPVDALNYSHK
jgi:4-amino-4-deoxy-L-arabinose transferase-like glycosyltransferase